jgi:hypothetical protein
VLVVLAAWGSALAKGPVPASLQELLFPPELVMRNQQELGISPEQRSYIVEQISEAQAQFTAVQWDLRSEVDALASMIEDPSVTEDDLMVKLEEVLDLERQVKRAQFTLALRMRKALNREQLEKLEELRRREPARLRRFDPRLRRQP